MPPLFTLIDGHCPVTGAEELLFGWELLLLLTWELLLLGGLALLLLWTGGTYAEELLTIGGTYTLEEDGITGGM